MKSLFIDISPQANRTSDRLNAELNTFKTTNTIKLPVVKITLSSRSVHAVQSMIHEKLSPYRLQCRLASHHLIQGLSTRRRDGRWRGVSGVVHHLMVLGPQVTRHKFLQITSSIFFVPFISEDFFLLNYKQKKF